MNDADAAAAPVQTNITAFFATTSPTAPVPPARQAMHAHADTHMRRAPQAPARRGRPPLRGGLSQRGRPAQRGRPSQNVRPSQRDTEIDLEHSDNEMDVDQESNGEFNMFIDDGAQSVRSGVSGYRGPASECFDGDGQRASYDGGEPDEGKGKKRVRCTIRKLEAIFEIGLLRDYRRRFPECLRALRSVCNEPAPYTWYCNLEHPHDTADVQVQSGVFLTPSQASSLNDTAKLHSLAVKFADYGDQTHHVEQQPLRRIDALMQFAEGDPFNYPRVSPVCEMICANNIVNPRNEIDRQPCDSIRGELVAKGDPYTQQHLRDGYARGGPPGLPSVVLWRIKDGTSVVDVDNTVLRLWKYWNAGISRPELLGDNKLDVQNPFAEFYYDGKKRFKSARVCIESLGCDLDPDADAFRRHVHPAIMAKLDDPRVHPSREQPYSSASEAADTIISSRFSCCVHVIPHQVRDAMGRTRNVIMSVLRIRSTVPGCDPIVALRCLTALPGFSQDLIKVTQHMMCCLNFSGGSSIDQLFDTTLRNNKHNLASVGHEANLGLGFFGYLKNKYILTRRSSVQSACFDQKFRINIFDKSEVAELTDFLEIAHHSRKQYYAQVVLHSCHDMSNARSAALPLPSSGEDGVDWRLFFPGMHWKAVRKDALRLEYRRDALDGQFDGDLEEFLALQPDPEHVFVQCDGASFKSGYVIFCQSKIRSEDSPDMLKLQAQVALKEGSDSIQVGDAQEMSPVYFCSKRFELFCNYFLSATDPYAVFLDASLPNVPHIHVLLRNEKTLTLAERTLLACMTNAPDDGLRLDRGQIKTAMIETAYGLRGCALHAQLSSIDASCESGALLEQTVQAIRTKVKEYLHFGSNCTMGQLSHGARFALDLARLDEDPPTASGQSIADQHMAMHAKVALGTVSDDAQAARREVENCCQFKSELNFVNASVLRLLLCAHPSLWSCTNDGAYGYCFQICDGGNSFRVQLIKGGRLSEDFVEFDLKSPGSGADMLWNIFGELVNAFPKFMSIVDSMREFFTANPFCELWQQKSHMAFMRANGIAKNIRGTVVDSLSEHNKNFGKGGAMLELNKQEQSKEKVDSVWPNIEMRVGQSGVTENGVKQTPYSTTIAGMVVNIDTLNPLHLLLVASNLISVSRPPSVNDGGRVNPVTAGSSDLLGRIEHKAGGCGQHALEVIVASRAATPTAPGKGLAPGVPKQQARPRELSSFTSDITESNDPVPIDDKIVERQMAMFLLEYMARLFAMVHRGLCFKRRVNVGWGSFTWRHIKDCCMHGTTNMRKATYADDDKMARHMNGTLETLLFGKWVRCILGMSMHRRLMLTEGAGREQRTQLCHVLPDALVTMALVPVTVTTVLSALQLYWSMVVLDVGVMIVSCMVLYFNRSLSRTGIPAIPALVRLDHHPHLARLASLLTTNLY